MKTNSRTEVVSINEKADRVIGDVTNDPIVLTEPPPKQSPLSQSPEVNLEPAGTMTAMRGYEWWLEKISPVIDLLKRSVRKGSNVLGNLITGKRRVSTQFTFVLMLRAVGVLIAVSGFLFPLYSFSLSGFGGYLLDVIANLLVGFALFSTAEVVQTIYQIDARASVMNVEEEEVAESQP